MHEMMLKFNVLILMCCHDPSLGLVTKARPCEGVGQ